MKGKELLILSVFLLFVFSFKIDFAGHTKKDRPKIENNGVLIDYTDTGNADTTLLFVHGWCLNKSYWSNQVAYFNKKYRVITIDMPGFGSSGKKRKNWSTATYASDVNAIINQLRLKKVILIGHSMAGDIILQTAINNPHNVIGIVGVDNFKAVGHKLSKKEIINNADAINEMKHHFKKIAYQYFNQSLFYKTTSKSIKERILADVSRTDSVIVIKILEGTLKQMQYDEGKLLLKYKRKLYLINSDYTNTDTLSLVARRIPHQILYIHATGHFPMVEKPVEFNSKLSKIIKSIKTD